MPAIKAMTTEEFIKKARKVHGNKYGYDKVEYKNNNTPVVITCPIHGEFKQRPNDHLSNMGCSKCGRDKKASNNEEFIKKAIKVHGERYDYSQVKYFNSHTKVEIICPIHGVYEQRPNDHLKGMGCPQCASTKSNTEEFIKKAKAVHGDKYDYSKVQYKNNSTPVTITCPIHGEFQQIPNNHLRGMGCPQCGNIAKHEKNKSNEDEFISKARKVHEYKYDYSKVDYVNDKTKIVIICLKHGEFLQRPNLHLLGNGCPKCKAEQNGDRLRSNTEEFIKKARKVHSDKYDYSKVNYVNNETKVIIACPKHGEFEQRPNGHLGGLGCPKCGVPRSKIEIRFFNMIQEHYSGKMIPSDRKILKGKELDIYLPEIKLGIEVNGYYWHSEKTYYLSPNYQGKDLEFYRTHLSDKYKKCCNAGIALLSFTDLEIVNHPGIALEMVMNRVKHYPKAKTEIAKLKNEEIREFFEKTSLKPFQKARVNYALVDGKGKIRTALSFSRTKEEDKWKIINAAYYRNEPKEYEKLIQRFITEHSECKRIVWLSDNRFDETGVVQSLGFQFRKEVAPSYCYSYGDNESALTYLKKEIEEDLREPEEEGYYRLWNAGEKEWSYRVEGE